MFSLPGYRFLIFNQPKPGACHRLFLVGRHGFFMQTNVTAKVEHRSHRCCNKCCKMYGWHGNKIEQRTMKYDLVSQKPYRSYY